MSLDAPDDAGSMDVFVVAEDGRDVHLVQQALVVLADPLRGLDHARAVTTSSGTSLTWQSRAADLGAAVTLDGEVVETADSGSAVVRLPLGRSGRLRADIEGYDGADEPALRTVGFDIRPPETRIEDASGLVAGDVVAMVLPTVSATKMEYEVFIPDKYVPGPPATVPGTDFPCEGGEDYYYGGDDRTAAYGTGDFRTQALLQYSWKAGVAIFGPTISPTTRYIKRSDGTYDLESTRTASYDRFTGANKIVHGTQGIGQLGHDVGNPYCTEILGITYEHYQDVSRSGGYTVSGGHEEVPDHQLYQRQVMSDGTTRTRQVFHHRLDSFNCLFLTAPGCVPRTYEYQYAG